MLRSKFSPEPYDRILVREGVILPNLTFTSFEGNEVKLSEMNYKLTIINFWATWCDACLEEMPSLIALRDSFQDQGLEIVGLNLDDAPEEVVPMVMKKYQMKFPIYVDPEGRLAEFFDIHAIPRTIFLGKNKEVLLIHDGQEDWNSDDMHQQIRRWLSE